MRYALIGCGRIAVNHMIAVRENGLELTAMCDLEPDKIEALLNRSGMDGSGVRRYTSYRKMLEENDLDLVAIATDSGEHASIALDCIRRGINVIIEKPIAMSMADAQQILSQSEALGVKVAVCHQNRFNTAAQQMHAAREAGRFGKLSHGSVHIRWNRGKAYYEQAQWRGKWASDGGALMNQCIHGIDLLLWMVGSPVTDVYGVTRQQLHGYLECEDVGLAVLSFADGTVATIEGTVNVYPKNLEETLYLFGENGTAKLGGTATNTVDLWQFRDSVPEDDAAAHTAEVVSNVYGNGHARLYADMLEAIRENRPPMVDAAAGMRALEVILAIYKSQKTGQRIHLPLTDFASTDMAGTFSKEG